jgi:hypothetical protein
VALSARGCGSSNTGCPCLLSVNRLMVDDLNGRDSPDRNQERGTKARKENALLDHAGCTFAVLASR